MQKPSKLITLLLGVTFLALLVQAAVILQQHFSSLADDPDSMGGARAAMDRMCGEAEHSLEILYPGAGLGDTTLTLATANPDGDPAIINVTYALEKHRLTRLVKSAGEGRSLESGVLAGRVRRVYFARPDASTLQIQMVVITEPKQGRRLSRTVKLTQGRLPVSSSTDSAGQEKNVLQSIDSLPVEVRTPQTPPRAELHNFLSNFFTDQPAVELPEHYCPNCGALIGRKDPCPNCARGIKFLSGGKSLTDCTCGAANIDAWEFCYKCGLKLRKSPAR